LHDPGFGAFSHWRAAGGASVGQRVRIARREVTQRDGGAAARNGPRLCASRLLAVLAADVVVGEASRPRIFDPSTVPATDTALVFGAGVEPDGSPSAMLGDRLDLAVQLYRARKVRRLLLSADDRAGDRETPAMLARVLAAGDPRDRVLVDDRGFSTRDSCARAHAAFGLSTATLVTQSYHLPRALFVCRALGVDGVGVGAPDWRNYTIATMLPHTAREALATAAAAVRAALRRT
jgi:vancomycin permeability regulator SanA